MSFVGQRAACVVALLALRVSIGQAEQCHEDDLEALEFSLLQTSLQLERPQLQRGSIEASAANSSLVSVEAIGRTLRSRVSLILQLVMPSEKTAVSGILPLVVCMLAAVVLVVFMIQLIGIQFERRSDKGFDSPSKSGQPYLEPLFGPDGQERHVHTSSLPPLTLPGRGRRAPQDSDRSLRSLAQNASLLPSLIREHDEARFCILADGIAKLVKGVGQTEVLGGQSRQPLMCARLSPEGAGGGKWLELCTSPTSRFPHCSAGPLHVDGRQEATKLEIRGPSGCFGVLVEKGSGWHMERPGGDLLMAFTLPGHGKGVQVLVDGQISAEAVPGQEALQVLVKPGFDPLPILVSIISLVLIRRGAFES